MIHSAPLILPVSAPFLHDGALVVRHGRIVATGPRREILAEWQGEEETRWDGMIVAGLVNAHTHLQYTSMDKVGRQRYASLEEWSTAFDEVYFGAPVDWAASAREGARQAVRYGTTSAADVVTDLEALGALREAGLGGLPYLEVLGDTDESWAASGRERFVALLEAAGQPVGISPHAPYTLDTGVLGDVTRLAHDRGLRLHIHLAEGEHEREYTVSGTGPLARMVRGLEFDFAVLREGGTGLGPAALLGELGMLGPGCHIAHGVYLDADDRALLRARGTAVALCPRSNRTLGLEGPDVAALLTEGNLVAVGTDSLASSPSLDVLADVAALRDLAVRQGYRAADLDRRLIEAATLGGAHAMGIEGGLAPGGPADFAVFDIEAGTEPYRALIEEGPGRCLATIIGGKMIWDSRTSAATDCYSAGFRDIY
ncbi:amidohydrolase family protein [Streptosporangium lutulentum]|uniref:Cytosine/adenosine deaminase-related metal-dependent hydrolase n=1 Tax=Streptosporangium lutulentum TaxID=1461250 RepID=A0ABT9QPA5_9ACTN|nr:amidohydrolase family protein [Streptosporangium lutulentum]MDP9848581.1 cytosine/adenosine deaminase-related metal-dependent hydrolase [Streptosporangium lutulentum]